MAIPTRLFLVGPMGAGKTTVGRRLARQLGYDFVDADHEIEARTGVDIPCIFENEGEAGFREREARVIDDLTQRERVVLATGGGAVTNELSRKSLAERGAVVYLHAAVELQIERTERSRNRPLLQSGNREETLRRLFAQRDPLYRQIADVIVEANAGHPRHVVERVIAALAQQAWSERRARQTSLSPG